MITQPAPTEAATHYARAHEQHHGRHDLLAALRSYGELLELHPDAPEAAYSRTQILGIVSQVVPAKELLEVQSALALRRLEPVRDGSPASSR